LGPGAPNPDLFSQCLERGPHALNVQSVLPPL